MSGYTKLFGSILVSTVWELPLQSKIVWVTMLAMADWRGEVLASVPGLAKMAGVSREECEAALAAFLAPDPDSRSKEDDGRRIREIDGGWYLINHHKYTQRLSPDDRRARGAERQRRYMENKRKRQQASASVSSDTSNVNDDTQTQTQTQTTDPDLGATKSIQENAVEGRSGGEIRAFGSVQEDLASPGGVVAAPEDPPIAVFACSGKKGTTFAVTKTWVEQVRAAYPAVHVETEVQRALAWIRAHPTHRKTARGMPGFLVRWLSRAQDRGPPLNRLGIPNAAPTAPSRDPNCKGWHAGGKNTGRRNPRGQQAGCPECKSVYLRSWTEDDRPSEPTPIGNLFPGGQR